MKAMLDKGIDCFLALLLAAMTGVVFLQVFFRYVLNAPLSWPEEIARLMIVWMTYVGAYVAMREKKHIGFSLLVKKMSLRTASMVALATQLLIIFFLMVMVKEGFMFARKFLHVPLPYTELPMGWFAYSVFPVSGILMLIQMVQDFSKSLRDFRQS